MWHTYDLHTITCMCKNKNKNRTFLCFFFFLLNNNRMTIKTFKKSYQNQMKNKLLCTNNRNINFYTMVPLVWKWVEIQNPKPIPIFIKCQGSLCSNFRRICHLEIKLSQGSLQFSYNSNDGIILAHPFLTMLQYYNSKKP